MEAHFLTTSKQKQRQSSPSRSFSIFILILWAQIFTLTSSQLAASTIYSGVTYNYNKYLSFGGNTGIVVPETVTTLSTFTMSVWFKMDQTPWGNLKTDMSIVQFATQAFSVVGSKLGGLQFRSDTGTVQTVSGDIRTGQWYVIIITSKSSAYSLSIYTLSNILIGTQTSSSFFPTGQSSLSFSQIYIGIKSDSTSSPFYGSIRNLMLFANTYTATQIWNSQFIRVYPTTDLRVQILMNSPGDYNNYAGQGRGTLLGQTKSLPQQVDYMGIWWCWDPLLVFPNVVDFTQTQFRLSQYQMTQNYDTSSVTDGTVMLWVLREPGVIAQNEVLFNHDQMISLQFTQATYGSLQFTGRNARTIYQPMRQSIWYYVQSSTSSTQYQHYIADYNGNKIYGSGVSSYGYTISGTTNTIEIATNLQGFMRGVKYYKTFITTPAAVSMIFSQSSFDSTSTLMFYFLFQDLGYSSTDNDFVNFAMNNFQQTLQIAYGNVQFQQPFWFDMNKQTSSEGTINTASVFDGYTCLNNKTRLYMSQTSSYANSIIQLTQQDTTFSIEFWMRPTSSFAGTANMITLADFRSTSSIYFMIRQESQQLYCYPQQGTSSKLQYNDFSTNPGTWQHISCVYDGGSRTVSGTYYYNQNDYTYSAVSQFQAVPIPAIQYTLQVNAGPNGQSPGYAKAYFQEIKFWNYAKNLQDIQLQRFNQVDLISNQQYLYSYMKLLNGGFAYSSEIDFADPNLQRQVTFSGTTWTANTEILICPVGYYHFTSSMTTCYRDGVSSATVIPYKSATNYTIVSQNLIFKNAYLTQYASSIFNIGWILTSVQTQGNATDVAFFQNVFNPQASNTNLVFTYNMVAQNPGQYAINYQVADNQQYEVYYTQSVTLKTMNCLSLYINGGQEDSLVYVDITTQLGGQPAYISFTYSQCSTYLFDTSQLTFVYLNVPGLPTANVPLYSPKNGEIMLSVADQKYFTFGTQYTILMKYAWKNQKLPMDSISYYKEIVFRFVPNLQVQLQQNIELIIAGQTLVLTSTGTQITNANGNYQASFQWICPGQLQTYCTQVGSASSLSITYLQYQNSNLSPFTPYQFILIGSAIIPQYNIDQSQQQSITVTWIPFNTQATIVGNQNPVTSQINAYQVNIVNQFTDNQITLSWSISPQVSTNLYLNSNTWKQFVLNQNTFQAGTTYTLTCQIRYAQNGWSLWNGTYTVAPSLPPTLGNVVITPNTGIAYQTVFTISTKSWKSPYSPFKYQYCYISSSGAVVPLSPKIVDLSFAFTLPPNIKNVIVVAYDIYYSSTASSYVSVQVSNATSVASTNSNILALVQSVLQSSATSATLVQKAYILTQNPDFFTQQNIQQTIYQIVQSLDNSIQTLITQSTDTQQFVLKFAITILETITDPTITIAFTPAINLTYTNAVQDTLISFIGIQASQLESQLKLSTFNDVTTYSQSIFGSLQQDTVFNRAFLQIQSNILSQLQAQFIIGNLTQLDGADVYLSQITNKMRTILTNYEAFQNQMAFESSIINYDLDYLQFQVSKYSRLQLNALQDISQTVIGQGISQQSDSNKSNQMSFYFPLSSAQQPTDRQGFSIISYKANPFFGSYYLNQTLFTNQSIYFAYRDMNGTYLGSDQILSRINMSFPFYYDDFSFLPNITVCGYIGNTDTQWGNKSCLTSFDRASGLVHCSCQHMSTYAVYENYLVRPFTTPLIYLSFQNWPSFAVFMYMIFIFILGVIYTYNKDNQDFRFLYEQDHNISDGDTSSLTLNSLAFKRQVFYMAFSMDFTFFILYKLYVMQLHPLFQLKYKLDAQIPRFYKFLVIYTRLMIIMGASFFCLRNSNNFQDMDPVKDNNYTSEVTLFVIITLGGGLILVPIPIFFYACFKSKYYVIQNKDGIDEDAVFDDEADQAKYKKKTSQMKLQTKVYIDPSIPIRLLFLINTVPISEMVKNYDTKVPYASGTSHSLGKKLKELQDDKADLMVEYESESSNRDVQSDRELSRLGASNMTNQNLNTVAQPNLKQHSSVQNGPNQKEPFVTNSQYRTHVQGKINPAIFEENTNVSQKNNNVLKSQSSYGEDHIDENEEDEEQKYNQDYSRQQHNKTESKMIDPSQIQFDFNNEENQVDDDDEEVDDQEQFDDNQVESEPNENIIDDDDSEYKEGGEGESSPQNKGEAKGQQPTGQTGHSQTESHIQNDRGESGFGLEFENSRQNQQALPQTNQQQLQRQESSGGTSSVSDTTINTQDFITNKKELRQERNFFGRLFGILLAVIINGGIMYYVTYLYVTEKYYNAGYQYVWVISFFLAQILGFLVFDFLALLIMALSVACCCKNRKTCMAYTMRESLIIYEDYKFVFKLLHTNLN